MIEGLGPIDVLQQVSSLYKSGGEHSPTRIANRNTPPSNQTAPRCASEVDTYTAIRDARVAAGGRKRATVARTADICGDIYA